jgi:hypothetical protein
MARSASATNLKLAAPNSTGERCTVAKHPLAGFGVHAVWRIGGVPASARLYDIHLVPFVLAIPILDSIGTTSYEVIAKSSKA